MDVLFISVTHKRTHTHCGRAVHIKFSIFGTEWFSFTTLPALCKQVTLNFMSTFGFNLQSHAFRPMHGDISILQTKYNMKW